MAEKPDDQKEPAKGSVSSLQTGDNTEEKPFVLELERLLAPVPGDAPTGEMLRYEGTYDSLQEARSADNPTLPQGIWERGLKKANWNEVYSICFEALENRSKDLQIATWMLESLLHLYGFEGVREGLKLLKGMVENFWDENLYPEIVEDDLEGRLAPMVWLNEKLSLQLKMLPITMPQSSDSYPYTYSDWENANRLEKLAVKEKEAMRKADSEGKVTRAKFLGSVMFSPPIFYKRLYGNLKASLELVEDINSHLDEKCGKEAPSFAQFRETLENILRLVNNFLKEKGEDEERGEQETDKAGEEQPPEQEIADVKPVLSLSIKSRAEAYALLSAAADYLLIHEPHSPAPHLVKRAVSWGRMTLTELLQELIADDSDLKQIFKLLGLKVTENE